MKKIVYILLFVFIFGGFIYARIASRNRVKTNQTKIDKEETISLLGQAEIKREFNFPIENSKNKTLKFTLTFAQLTNAVANQGNPIQSKADKQFLIIFLELQNDNKSPLTVNSRDFVRLVGEGDKKFAPDLYNGQIEVPAISVKTDEIGFLVNAGQKQFQVQVGEIEKDKEIIEINF